MKLSDNQKNKLSKLADNNSFFRSLWNQYQDNEYLSEKQIKKLDEAYSGDL